MEMLDFQSQEFCLHALVIFRTESYEAAEEYISQLDIEKTNKKTILSRINDIKRYEETEAKRMDEAKEELENLSNYRINNILHEFNVTLKNCGWHAAYIPLYLLPNQQRRQVEEAYLGQEIDKIFSCKI